MEAQRGGRGDSVPDSAEHCKKKQISIRSPAGNCPGRRRIRRSTHPEPPAKISQSAGQWTRGERKGGSQGAGPARCLPMLKVSWRLSDEKRITREAAAVRRLPRGSHHGGTPIKSMAINQHAEVFSGVFMSGMKESHV